MNTFRLGVYSVVLVGIMSGSSLFGAAVAKSTRAVIAALPKDTNLDTFFRRNLAVRLLNLNRSQMQEVQRQLFRALSIQQQRQIIEGQLHQNELLRNLTDPRHLFLNIFVSAVLPERALMALPVLFAVANQVGLFAAVERGGWVVFNAIKSKFSSSKSVTQPQSPVANITPPSASTTVAPSSTSIPTDSMTQRDVITQCEQFCRQLYNQAHDIQIEIGSITMLLDKCPPDSAQHKELSAQKDNLIKEMANTYKNIAENRNQRGALLAQRGHDLAAATAPHIQTAVPSLTQPKPSV